VISAPIPRLVLACHSFALETGRPVPLRRPAEIAPGIDPRDHHLSHLLPDNLLARLSTACPFQPYGIAGCTLSPEASSATLFSSRTDSGATLAWNSEACLFPWLRTGFVPSVSGSTPIVYGHSKRCQAAAWREISGYMEPRLERRSYVKTFGCETIYGRIWPDEQA